MILTVTLNPSVDISYKLTDLNIDTTNRVSEVGKTAGGKGLNVTRVVNDLGKEVIATGFIGGKLGEQILDELALSDISSDFLRISGETRNCIAILHNSFQTEILESGPTINISENDQFLGHFKKLLSTSEVITFSGSLPNGVPENFYAELIRLANLSDKKTVLDSSGTSLKTALKSNYKPTVIKPNISELTDILQYQIDESVIELKNALSNDMFKDIEWIIVSLGKNGAFAKHRDTFYLVEIPTIKVANPVGSGDATVAGIATALDENFDDHQLLKHAMTAGMLNTMEDITGHVNLEYYDDLYKQVTVTEC